jgi:L-threonylcarbamoyladenylate synthase
VTLPAETTVLPATRAGVARAAAALRAGRLVAFPTETVYGLGADARNAAAVRAVFAAKGRPADHPLIIHLAAGTDPGQWAVSRAVGGSDRLEGDVRDRLEAARLLAAAFWPGPLTLVLPRGPRVLPLVTGGQETVALRVPANDTAQALLQESGLALVGPSANRFGRISPTSARHVLQELGGRIPFILDGGASVVGLESTILDLSAARPEILRPGAISAGQLAAVLQLPVGQRTGPEPGVARVPGSLASHYAPAARTLLLDAAAFEAFSSGAAGAPGPEADGAGVISFRRAPAGFSGHWRQLPADPAGYAQFLYATLRELDSLAALIVIERPPASPAWDAVNDRLGRAAA